jgi:histidine phosphotransfer protein HptB
MIDWRQVRDLHQEIGAECFAEVQAMFLEEVGTIIERLRNNQDIANLEADLHALKGSVIILGFVEVASLCQQGEALLAKGGAEQVDVRAVLQAYDLALSNFLAERDKRLPS